MGFLEEESGQLGPFEDLTGAIIGLFLITLLLSSVAYSYEIYDRKRDALERFEAGLDFLHFLKNDAFSVKSGKVIKPSLIDAKELSNYDRSTLSTYWNKGYGWKVVLRDYEGNVIYEVEREKAPSPNKDVSVVLGAVAIRYPEGTTGLGRLEVWVW